MRMKKTDRIRAGCSRIMIMMLVICMAISFSFVTVEKDVFAAANNPVQADTIMLQKNISGKFPAGTTDDAYHYYKFKTLGAKGVKYVLKCANISIDESTTRRMEYSIIDSNYVDCEDADVKVSEIVDGYYFGGGGPIMYLWKSGSSGSITYNSLKPNSEYFVKVKFYNFRDTSEDNTYAIQVAAQIEKPSKPALKTVKPGKRVIKVSYKKAKYADRYQIQIKKGSGSWKTYNNGSKLNKTFKKLKKGKKYSVRVRAQRKVNGKWYNSKWSTKKTVTVK